MSERIPQSIAKRVVFRAFLSSDGQTPATGKTIAITISKNGGAFGNPAAGATNATAISSGFYYFDLGTSDTGTLGPLAWRGAEGTIDDAADVYEVVTEILNVQTTVDAILLDTGTDGVVVAAGSKTGYSLASGGAGSGSIAAAELNNIADAVLDRNMATGTDSGSTTVRTSRQALRLLRNARSISAGTLSVKKEDDSTNSWTAAVTTATGDPIDSVDPAGP